ncbi:hypothetical protein PAMA_000278 [Pampus argenteus]
MSPSVVIRCKIKIGDEAQMQEASSFGKFGKSERSKRRPLSAISSWLMDAGPQQRVSPASAAGNPEKGAVQVLKRARRSPGASTAAAAEQRRANFSQTP